jgi:hypothetical protein
MSTDHRSFLLGDVFVAVVTDAAPVNAKNWTVANHVGETTEAIA